MGDDRTAPHHQPHTNHRSRRQRRARMYASYSALARRLPASSAVTRTPSTRTITNQRRRVALRDNIFQPIHPGKPGSGDTRTQLAPPEHAPLAIKSSGSLRRTSPNITAPQGVLRPDGAGGKCDPPFKAPGGDELLRIPPGQSPGRTPALPVGADRSLHENLSRPRTNTAAHRVCGANPTPPFPGRP